MFVAGTVAPTGVVMTQSSIYDERSDKDTALVAEIAAAYLKARPAYDRARESAYWIAYEARLGRPLPEF